ncbi:MAG TPA: DNA-binding response regulator [Bdellovibrionales bacterium]|nr:DNA-binding response regulator [Bdellovibrionales bacterium]
MVEDSVDIRELMVLHLERASYKVVWASNGEDAIKFIQSGENFDLVVLDWMLPGLSGIDVCRQIQRKIPVLMATARALPDDIILGLESGADDYITKPFDLPVFLARVRALLRRGEMLAQGSARKYKVGQLLVDVDAHLVKCGTQEVRTTTYEFKLLATLMANQGKVLSREALIEQVQGEGVIVIDRAIDTHIFGLRKKLGACADVIETIRGVGYRIKTDNE